MRDWIAPRYGQGIRHRKYLSRLMNYILPMEDIKTNKTNQLSN